MVLVVGHAHDAWQRGCGVRGRDGEYRTALDFLAYADGFALMRAGRDPYALGTQAAQTDFAARGRVGDVPCPAWPLFVSPDQRLAQAISGARLYLYPPTWAVVLAPVSQLGYPWLAVLGLVLNALALAGIIAELLVCARQHRGFPVWIAIGAGLATIHSLQCVIRTGQVSLILLWLVLHGARQVRYGRHRSAVLLGGALWALAIAIKVWPIIAAATLWWFCAPPEAAGPPPVERRRLYLLGLLGGLVLWLLLLPGAVLGWSHNLSLLWSWQQHILRGDPLVFDGLHLLRAPNQPLGNALRLLYVATHRGVDPLAPLPANWALAVLAVRAGLLALLAAVVALLARRRPPLAGEVAVSLGLAVALLCSPSLGLHAFILLVPCHFAIPAHLLATGRRRPAFAWATTNWVVPLLNGIKFSRFGLLGLGTAVLVVVACGLVLSGRVDRKGQTATRA